MTTEAIVDSRRTVASETLAPYEKIELIPPGTVLFREGAETQGVYYLHSGEVDLCFSSARSGEAKSLLIADAGQMLGLSSVMSGRTHDSTATARTTCITGFVEKARFHQLLEEKPALW